MLAPLSAYLPWLVTNSSTQRHHFVTATERESQQEYSSMQAAKQPNLFDCSPLYELRFGLN